jgi:hypothetical protein
MLGFNVRPVLQQVLHGVCDFHQVMAHLDEQLEELLFLGDKAKPHGARSSNRMSLFY